MRESSLGKSAVLGLVTAMAIAFGCSSFESETPATTDAGVDAARGAATDAGMDATITPAPSFCETMPDAALCKDFDEESVPIAAGFDTILFDAGARDSLFYASPPSSLVVVGQGPSVAAILERELTESSKGYDVRLQMRLGDDQGKLPDSQYLLPVRLQTGTSPNLCTIDLLLNNDSLDLVAEGDTPVRPPLLSRPQPGKWSAVHIDLTRDVDDKMGISMDVDGLAALNGQPITLPCSFKGKMRFAVGARYATAGLAVRFDDIAVHLH